jgi:hypothetical protein
MAVRHRREVVHGKRKPGGYRGYQNLHPQTSLATEISLEGQVSSRQRYEGRGQHSSATMVFSGMHKGSQARPNPIARGRVIVFAVAL